MSRLFRVSTLKIETANYKSFLAFSIWLGLFPNFRKIEPTVSYNQFPIKNACISSYLLVIETGPGSMYGFIDLSYLKRASL